MKIKPPTRRAGDAVELMSMMDVVIGRSACPQDMAIVNGADMTPKEVEFQVLRASGN